MTTRRSGDLGPSPLPRSARPKQPKDVPHPPLVVGPEVVLEIARRQRERSTEGAPARHAPRKRLRKP